MVGNRDHPLNQRHYNEDTLEEFVLGQLLPDEETQIQQHSQTQSGLENDPVHTLHHGL